MAKDFSAIYGSQNDAVALEQKIFIKAEGSRGTLEVPTDADFINALSGSSVNFTQPVESSPVRSGRHHSDVIKQKTSTSWTIPSFFHIDTLLGAAAPGEIDPGMRVLWQSLLGKEDVTGGSPVYTTAVPPDITFSIYENGDQWAIQAPGAFVDAGNASFPGDGQSQIEFSGMAKTALTVGIGQSVVDNNGGTDITLASGEGSCFPVGAKVMIVESDGVTRSGDSPNGSALTVVSVAGDVVTLDATLADADGSGTPIYLVYYEPEAPVAINDPQTGLEGSITIVGFSSITNCVRSATVNMTNAHELQDFCYGEEGLGGQLFTPGSRFTAEVTLEINLNKSLVKFLNEIKNFDGEDITLILGDAAGRHFQMEMPKVIFNIPEISVPDTGTIPISFSGTAYQSAAEAADEVTASFL